MPAKLSTTVIKVKSLSNPENDNDEITPKTKHPTILAIITFEHKMSHIIGNELILYLTNAPKIAPMQRKRNSIFFNDKMPKWLLLKYIIIGYTKHSGA